jgi:hypothetical protein
MSRTDPFELDGLRIAEHDLAALGSAAPKRTPRHRSGEPFLRGPVPWKWIQQAGALPGKALAVGLLLWLQAGCSKGRVVRFSMTRAAELGCHPDTVRRGIHALESAGLVRVERPAGRCLLVTLLDAPGDNVEEQIRFGRLLIRALQEDIANAAGFRVRT